jgi:hypothetical protein
VGTVFTFVAAAAFDAAAPVLVAGIAPAFNGFSAAGLVATLFAFFASEGAGFFELGIRPRYDKKRQAGSQARRHTRTAPPARAQARTKKQLGKRKKFLNRQDVGRSFGVQSLRLLTLSAGIYRWSALR